MFYVAAEFHRIVSSEVRKVYLLEIVKDNCYDKTEIKQF